MIQELFGERNYSSINGGGVGVGVAGGVLLQPTTQPPSSLPSNSQPPSSTTTTTTTTTTITSTTTTSLENQNLRCPRCDSSNTKFCYYNNYNLTQPRHFCKTCRRYWTKGGALRNVPIGGGCRKNKNIGVLNTAAKTTASKMKMVASEFIGRSVHGQGFDLEHIVPPTSQILWGSPQNSHLLSLLRFNQSQNPNPNHVTTKEDGNINLMGSSSSSHSHMMSSEPLISNMLVNQRTTGGLVNSYDGVGHVLCNPFWRNNQNGNFVLGEQQHQHQHHHENSGIHELYQKLRSSTSSSSGNNNNNNCSEISGAPVFLGNVATNSSSISNILETTFSVGGGGELGYWNPTLSWSDLQTTNGSTAYP